jgi:hypothetical protein
MRIKRLSDVGMISNGAQVSTSSQCYDLKKIAKIDKKVKIFQKMATNWPKMATNWQKMATNWQKMAKNWQKMATNWQKWQQIGKNGNKLAVLAQITASRRQNITMTLFFYK